MRILGDSFVLGRTIEEALARAAPLEAKGYRFSYDMLGERARTASRRRRVFRPLHGGRRRRRPGAPGRRAALRAAGAAGAARPLGQALGPASALRPRQGGAPRCASCCRASSSLPPPRGATASGSPSTPRSRTASIRRSTLFAAAFMRSRAQGLAGPRPCRAGLRQAGDPGAALAAAAGARRRASRSRCGSSRAPTGTARSSGRRSAALPTIRC